MTYSKIYKKMKKAFEFLNIFRKLKYKSYGWLLKKHYLMTFSKKNFIGQKMLRVEFGLHTLNL
jgi:hypothetical protein